jgi:hypothetical protein
MTDTQQPDTRVAEARQAVTRQAVTRQPGRALKLGSLLVEEPQLTSTTSAPANFRFGQVSSVARLNPVVLSSAAPDLGALVDFVGNWTGNGFNTIFRPNSPSTPTELPVPAGGDNILELNLTSETLSFSGSLGSVPNRGMVQDDAFLNGVPYLQSINDVTVAGQSVGVHVEPGLWMAVPPTADPAEGQTYSRMASIPHGTTINAQGTSSSVDGPPTIPAVDITPFVTGSGNRIPFASQNAAAQDTPRIPQDLTAWIAAGTITQAMLDDPNSVLRDHIAGQHIVHTTEITISTAPAAPLFGGGADNIAFLLGDSAAAQPNAQSAQVSATFWIETVQHTLHVPAFLQGQTSLRIAPNSNKLDGDVDRPVILTPPVPLTQPRTITFTTKQIQYSQTVLLNFKGLSWPHVSVATLTPAGPITVPPSAWS